MRITDVRTFLVYGGTPERAGWRHWLFVKVHTDTGLYGVGECWGWPRVVQTAIEDLKPLVVGEDPFLIERIWQKLFASTQGHGMTGVVGSGAITGIELALWDLKGKALDTPVWNLLGGKIPGERRPAPLRVMTGQPVIEGGHILIPDRPGLGVDLDEEAIERYPLQGNAIPVEEDPVTTTITSPLTGAAPPGSPAKTIRYSWIPLSAIRITSTSGRRSTSAIADRTAVPRFGPSRSKSRYWMPSVRPTSASPHPASKRAATTVSLCRSGPATIKVN